MYHGNLEISEEELAKARAQLDERVLQRLIEERSRDERIAERTILVVAHLTHEAARFVIRDQGRGFNVRIADTGRGSDNFEGGMHRGLTLIRSLMDEVTFNDSGNELTLHKRSHTRTLQRTPR
jgi:anti-sigma regulatory factor (Ser/Thr protein kinase)